MLSRVSYTVKTCDEAMAQYDFTTATTACYNMWLYDLCDVYLVSIFHNYYELFERNISFLYNYKITNIYRNTSSQYFKVIIMKLNCKQEKCYSKLLMLD